MMKLYFWTASPKHNGISIYRNACEQRNSGERIPRVLLMEGLSEQEAIERVAMLNEDNARLYKPLTNAEISDEIAAWTGSLD